MGRGSNEAYNMISIFFVALSALVCALTLLILGDVVPAGPLEPATDVPTATLALVDGRLPTFTPSDTPLATRGVAPTETPSVTPTWTGLPTNTFTPTISPTPTSTATGTATFTLSPTWTFTPSLTFTVTPTFTSTATVAVPTVGAPPGGGGGGGGGGVFTVPPSFPLMRDAFTHPGCQWQGIGGQVNGSTGPLPGITVKVTNPDGTSNVAVSGTAPSYGQSGWEIQVASAPTPGIYQVQVVAADQVTPLSNAVSVQFQGTCEQNLAVVNFIQVQ